MKSKMWSLFLTTSALVTLLGSAIPAHATFPGKNGRIAFVLGPDIYTMNPDGSDVRRGHQSWPGQFGLLGILVTRRKVDCLQQSFSRPDIYLNGQLWIMNADGSNQHLLLAEPGFTGATSFSPDGKTMIFSRGYDINPDAGHSSCSYIALTWTALASHKLRTIQLVASTTMGLKYSPDGNSIVFQGDDLGGILGAAWVIGVDGGPVRQVTPSAISGRRPDWSPEG